MHLHAASVHRLVAALDRSRRFPAFAGELSVVCLDTAAMIDLHTRFFDDPTPTDVITFPGDAALGSAGEICVCADVAIDYARAHRVSWQAELALYVAHGYLHLAGYDDRTPAVRRAMRSAERVALATIRRILPIEQLAADDRRRPR